MSSEPDQYTVAEARTALAEDPRAAELSLMVEVVAGKLCVTGTVATEARRAAVTEVLQERFPSIPVVNQTSVAEMSESTGSETVT